MTTINNLSIEQMREIVEGASFGTHYRVDTGEVICCPNENHFYFQENMKRGVEFIRIDDIRTVIAEHDSKIQCWACDKRMTEVQLSFNDGFCIHCESEIELSKPSKQLESDDCTDIRNHLSPNTKVINHG